MLAATCLSALAACAAVRVVDGAYESRAVGLRLPLPPAPWVQVDLPDVDVAFQHPGAGGTIVVFSECSGGAAAPMRILARRLLFGLKSEVVDQSPVALDGAEALRTTARGTLGGRPVQVESLVVRRNDCVADVVLAASPAAFPALRPDFDRMAAGLRLLP
jgi:hypothetical protein